MDLAVCVRNAWFTITQLQQRDETKAMYLSWACRALVPETACCLTIAFSPILDLVSSDFNPFPFLLATAVKCLLISLVRTTVHPGLSCSLGITWDFQSC